MGTDVGGVSDPEPIVYRYKPSFYEVEEDRVDLVVLTSEGDLIESYGNETLCRCTLCPASTTYVNLKLFYTYEPHFKYYVVQIRDQLYIVKRVDRCTLKLERTLENVSHFSIEDKNNIGEPQFLVWSTGAKTPFMLNVFFNFIDEPEVATCKIIPNSILKIKAQAKALESQIKQTEKVIFDKTILAYKMCSPNTFNHQEKLPPSWNSGNTLFKALGANKPKLKPPAKVSPISLGEPWLRVLPDIIIVGFYVCNLQECEIRKLALTALDPSLQFMKTVVFRTSRGFDFDGELADFKPSSFLAGRTQGYVIGVMKEPLCIQKTLLLELILSFSIENNKRTEQLYVGDIHVAHESLVSYNHLPFQNSKEDLLVLIAVCSTVDIVHRVDEASLQSMKSVLLEMGFFEIGQQFLFYSFTRNSAFSGMVVLVIKEETYSSLRIYFRKIQQLFLFTVSLKNKLVSCGQLEERYVEPTASICSNLNEEIKALHKYFSSNSFHSSSETESQKKMSVDPEFLSELLSLETVTEKSFPLLHQFDDQQLCQENK